MKIVKTYDNSNLHQVINSEQWEVLFEGTRSECEKFIFDKISQDEHDEYQFCINNNPNFN